MQKTNVIFLFEKDSETEVFAYFPQLKECYAHIGQHSACSIEYVNECKICVEKENYSDLYKELTNSVGYLLNVLNFHTDSLTFNSHKNHNPHCDILEGKLDGDSFITYYIELKTGNEGMEYYKGENYVVGSNKKSFSRIFKSEQEIPTKYRELWEVLKKTYQTCYKYNPPTNDENGYVKEFTCDKPESFNVGDKFTYPSGNIYQVIKIEGLRIFVKFIK